MIAPQGTAFTDQHARILKRLAKEVVICFDADRAGQNAAQRCIDVLLKEDLQVRIARIPQGEDPDSLLRKQPVEVFQTLLHDAKDYTRHLLDTACETEDITSPRGRGVVAQKMAQVIVRIPNAVQREGFLLEVARRVQVSRSVLEEEVRKAEAQMRRSESDRQRHDLGTPEEEMSPGGESNLPLEPLQPDIRIEALLSLLLAEPGLVPEVARQLNPVWIEGLAGAEVLLRLLDVHAHDAWNDSMQFMEECDERTRNYLAGLPFKKDQTQSYIEALGKNLTEKQKLWLREYAVATTAQSQTPNSLALNSIGLMELDWNRKRLQFLTIAAKSEELSIEERMKYLMEIQTIRRQFPDLEP